MPGGMRNGVSGVSFSGPGKGHRQRLNALRFQGCENRYTSPECSGRSDRWAWPAAGGANLSVGHESLVDEIAQDVVGARPAVVESGVNVAFPETRGEA